MKKTILTITTCLMITLMIMPCNTFAASTKTIPAKSAMAISLSKQRYTKNEKKAISVTKNFLNKIKNLYGILSNLILSQTKNTKYVSPM